MFHHSDRQSDCIRLTAGATGTHDARVAHSARPLTHAEVRSHAVLVRAFASHVRAAPR